MVTFQKYTNERRNAYEHNTSKRKTNAYYLYNKRYNYIVVSFLLLNDICKMFHIGRVKCLELFHRADFPAQKYGRGFGIEANALAKYMSSRHIIS